MYFKQWLALGALISLSVTLLPMRVFAPVIPGNGIGHTPRSVLPAHTATDTGLKEPVAVTESHKEPIQAPTLMPKTPTSSVVHSSPTQPSKPEPVSLPRASSPQKDITSEIADNIHTLVNEERVAEKLLALKFDTKLAAIAQAHSTDMLSRRYFSHTDPDGCSFACRIQNSGLSYWAIGENIYTLQVYKLDARATAAQIVEGWMQSPGHRANILNAAYVSEGVGVSTDGDTIMVTQNLAKFR